MIGSTSRQAAAAGRSYEFTLAACASELFVDADPDVYACENHLALCGHPLDAPPLSSPLELQIHLRRLRESIPEFAQQHIYNYPGSLIADRKREALGSKLKAAELSPESISQKVPLLANVRTERPMPSMAYLESMYAESPDKLRHFLLNSNSDNGYGTGNAARCLELCLASFCDPPGLRQRLVAVLGNDEAALERFMETPAETARRTGRPAPKRVAAAAGAALAEREIVGKFLSAGQRPPAMQRERVIDPTASSSHDDASVSFLSALDDEASEARPLSLGKRRHDIRPLTVRRSVRRNITIEKETAIAVLTGNDEPGADAAAAIAPRVAQHCATHRRANCETCTQALLRARANVDVDASLNPQPPPAREPQPGARERAMIAAAAAATAAAAAAATASSSRSRRPTVRERDPAFDDEQRACEQAVESSLNDGMTIDDE